jgi:glycosyltransferase involved in cell wall biosynthesis
VIIICAMLTLDYSGVPTYVLTLSNELRKRGHRVAVFCPANGGGRPLESQMEVYDTLEDLPAPDVMIAHHTPLAAMLQRRFPCVPLIFSSHGVPPGSGTEPPVGVRVDRYLAINEQVEDWLFSRGVPEREIDLVRDFVDLERFTPTSPLRADKPCVLFLSNHRKWNNYFYALDACSLLGLPFTAVGVPYGRSAEVENAINNADIVLSWGRGVLEAMACGRAVVSYDMLRFEEGEPSVVTGDGYLDVGGYFTSRQHNFGPMGCAKTFTSAEDVARELRRYVPGDGAVNRLLAQDHHGCAAGVDKVLACIGRARASC